MFVFTNINFMRKIERKLQKKRLIEFYLVSAFYDDPQQLRTRFVLEVFDNSEYLGQISG